MQGRKKLQDLFTDLHVPRLWRDRVPLLVNETGIAWVVGHRIAEWAKAPPDHGEEVLWISFTQERTL
jgi:tRNA(Ile)-lysidine synthase